MSTILVVEDSRTQRHMLTGFLADHAFSVTAVSNGVEALKQAARDRPDLVLLDIIMPKMHGYEVCRRLKANPLTKDVRVLLCSAQTTDADRYWGFKQGADGYLNKPFHPQELLDIVQYLLAESPGEVGACGSPSIHQG